MPVGIRREENRRKGKEKEGRGGKGRSLIIIAEKFFSLEKAGHLGPEHSKET